MYEYFALLLKSRGVTAYEVSKNTGIPQSTLSDWKRGRCTPKQDKLQKIADFFGVSIDYLVNGKEAKNYYIDEETRDYARFLFEHPKYKVLFDASRNVKAEDIDIVKKLLDKFADEEEGETE